MDDDPEHRRCGTLPQPVSVFQVAAQARPIKSTQQNRPISIIWESSPGCNHGLGWRERISPAGTAKNDSEPVLSSPRSAYSLDGCPMFAWPHMGRKRRGACPFQRHCSPYPKSKLMQRTSTSPTPTNATQSIICQEVTPCNHLRTVHCVKQWSTNKSIPLKI
jgi:hypothetical protein